MDTLAHGLWTFLIFHQTQSVWLAVLFGVLPDLASWGMYLLVNIANGRKMGPPKLNEIPSWVMTMYGVTHSVLVMGLVFVVTFISLGRIPIFLWAWPIHVLIDIPTHSRSFLPTPFLWPVSEWKFPGFSWGVRWFMVTNYTLLIIGYAFILSRPFP